MAAQLATVLRAECYVDIDWLPEACRPALVVRDSGATLLTIDPRSTNREATEWIVDHLTRPEMDVIRAAYGVGRCGTPAPEEWLEHRPVSRWVPEVLRLRQVVEESA